MSFTYSVVQHQLYLLQNVPDMTKAKAYDIARKQFYKHRMKEEIEQRVAEEEALAVGAYFDQSIIERGMELENQQYEQWKEWSEKESALTDQRTNTLVGVGNTSGEASSQRDGGDDDADDDDDTATQDPPGAETEYAHEPAHGRPQQGPAF